VLETFYGAVNFVQFQHFVHQQCCDSRITPQYHTVSDFTRATLRLSMDEVQQIVHIICRAQYARVGRRALVISGSRNFAFAGVFRSCMEQGDIVSQCFSYRDAALRWVTHAQVNETDAAYESFRLFRSNPNSAGNAKRLKRRSDSVRDVNRQHGSRGDVI